MKRGSKKVLALALLFFLFGAFWAVTIYKRCDKISPAPKVTRSLKKGFVASPAAASAPAENIRRVRSPYAQDYQIVLFWLIVLLEVACSLCYIISGLWLIRAQPAARQLAMDTLRLDLSYKMFVIAYMKFCALPLQHLTKNPNILMSYYMPDFSIYSKVSLYLSGLKVFHPSGMVYLMAYLVFFVFVMCFLRGRKTKRHS